MHVHSHTVIFLWIAILFVQTYTRITLSTDILGYLYALLYFDISMLTTIVKNNKNIF